MGQLCHRSSSVSLPSLFSVDSSVFEISVLGGQVSALSVLVCRKALMQFKHQRNRASIWTRAVTRTLSGSQEPRRSDELQELWVLVGRVCLDTIAVRIESKVAIMSLLQ